MASPEEESTPARALTLLNVRGRVPLSCRIHGLYTFLGNHLLNGLSDALAGLDRHATASKENEDSQPSLSIDKDERMDHKKTLTQKALHEFKEFAFIVLYLWVVLGLFLLYKTMLLNKEHISTLAQGFAIINALVLGKIILIARALRLGSRLDRHPLIYPTLLKSALFSLVLAAFKILESAVVSLYRGEPFRQNLSELGGGTVKGILTLTFLMFVVLIPFVGFTELQRVLGEGALGRIFLGSRSPRSEPDLQPR